MNQGGHHNAGEQLEDLYDVYEDEDDRVVIYDERNPDAYVRSDRTIELVR